MTVDALMPTPSTRSDVSNAPLFDTSIVDIASFPRQQKQQPNKRKRQGNSQVLRVKRQKLQTKTTTLIANFWPQTSLHITVQDMYQCLSKFQHTVARVLNESPQQILSHLVPL